MSSRLLDLPSERDGVVGFPAIVWLDYGGEGGGLGGFGWGGWRWVSMRGWRAIVREGGREGAGGEAGLLVWLLGWGEVR